MTTPTDIVALTISSTESEPETTLVDATTPLKGALVVTVPVTVDTLATTPEIRLGAWRLPTTVEVDAIVPVRYGIAPGTLRTPATVEVEEIVPDKYVCAVSPPLTVEMPLIVPEISAVADKFPTTVEVDVTSPVRRLGAWTEPTTVDVLAISPVRFWGMVG